MRFSFTVNGRAVGKERPRFGRNGARTPEKTKAFEKLVAWEYKTQGGKMMSGPIRISVTSFFEPPKRLAKARREELFYKWYTGAPDAVRRSACGSFWRR